MITNNDNKACLNCGSVVPANYCEQCGQPAETARLSFDRLLSSEFLTNIVDIDRGFFRACIDLIARPGELLRNYLAGQRKPYFHFAGLLLILLAIDASLLGLATNSEFTLLTDSAQKNADLKGVFSEEGYQTMYDFYKVILAFITPAIALAPYFLFRKIDYLYAEHIVIAWFYFSMTMLVSIFVRVVGIFPLDIDLFSQLVLAFGLVSFVLGFRFYWELSAHGHYSRGSRITRVTTVSTINMLISSMVPAYATWFFSS